MKSDSFKEERIRKIAPSYYARKDVIKAMFDFSKNREITPRYFQGFGKRPDVFHYPGDVNVFVKKGATSFNCSQEIWSDPLEISTDMSQEDLDNLREGWDLIIDIDCPWIDYSKKAAQAIILALEHKGVKNIGVKFSGSKGFHIIVPWSAFPEEINGIKTKTMFPSWPRSIVEYLQYVSLPILADLIKDLPDDFSKKPGFTGVKCETCNNISSENFLITLRCPSCSPPYIETFKSPNKEIKPKKCPNCKKELFEKDSIKFYYCSHCEIDSLENSNNFNEELISTDLYKILGLDVLLVTSRHLFRMPYSLHEKTGLASIVIPKTHVEKFDINEASPLNVRIVDFYPQAEKDEAKKLLIDAIDFYESNKKPEKNIFTSNEPKDFKPLKIKNLSEDNFPPAIQKILLGMTDGRKRALFILMNFFRSIGLEMNEIEKRLNEWNEKNKPPLKQGYINSQLVWHSKNKVVLPPNFDNPIYKELGIAEMDSLSLKLKNPVNYVVRKSFSFDKKSKKKK